MLDVGMTTRDKQLRNASIVRNGSMLVDQWPRVTGLP
jgi:hypothetical protein